jgi:hypothetical protein
LPPLRFHCVGGCWVCTQDCCDLAVRRSNHSARSHPDSARSHPPTMQIKWNDSRQKPAELIFQSEPHQLFLSLAGSLSGVEEERASLQQKLASGQLQLSKLEKKVRSNYLGAFRPNIFFFLMQFVVHSVGTRTLPVQTPILYTSSNNNLRRTYLR